MIYYYDLSYQDLLPRLSISERPAWFERKIVFLTTHGSNAYGLATEESDMDIGGICVPPKEFYYGFVNSCEQFQLKEPDGSIYNIQKFFKLAADANPNVMELLWIDPKFWFKWSDLSNKLIENRELFLSSKVRYTYSGYAMAQLKRIKTHKKWLLEPPTHQPTREEFGLPYQKLVTQDQIGALNQLINDKQFPDIGDETPNFMAYLQKENKYQAAKHEWEQYNNWKQQRNPKRAELEAKFGYDTKHAMHLVRLMRQAKEILTTGKLQVLREDREELLAVRAGAWPYEQLLEFAETVDKDLEKVYAETKLPKYPDHEKLDKLCVELIEKVNG